MELTLSKTLSKGNITLDQKFEDISKWSNANNLTFSHEFNFDNGYEYPTLLLSVKDNEAPDKRSVSVAMNSAMMMEVSVINKRRKNVPLWIEEFEKMLPEFKKLLFKYPPKIEVSKHYFSVEYESSDGALFPDPEDYDDYVEKMSFITLSSNEDSVEELFKQHLTKTGFIDYGTNVDYIEELLNKRELLSMTFDELDPKNFDESYLYIDLILRS